MKHLEEQQKLIRDRIEEIPEDPFENIKSKPLPILEHKAISNDHDSENRKEKPIIVKKEIEITPELIPYQLNNGFYSMMYSVWAILDKVDNDQDKFTLNAYRLCKLIKRQKLKSKHTLDNGELQFYSRMLAEIFKKWVGYGHSDWKVREKLPSPTFTVQFIRKTEEPYKPTKEEENNHKEYYRVKDIASKINDTRQSIQYTISHNNIKPVKKEGSGNLTIPLYNENQVKEIIRLHKNRKEDRLKHKTSYGNCPQCDSRNIKKSGTKIQRNKEVQRYQCKDCKRIFQKNNKEQADIEPKEKTNHEIQDKQEDINEELEEEVIREITRADILKETGVNYYQFYKALKLMPDGFGRFQEGGYSKTAYFYSEEEAKKLIAEINKQNPDIEKKQIIAEPEEEISEIPTKSPQNPTVLTEDKDIETPHIKDDEGVTRTFSIEQIARKLHCNLPELEEFANIHDIKPDVEYEYSLAKGSELMSAYQKNREKLPKEEMRVIKIKEVAEQLGCSKSDVKQLMQFSNKKIGEIRKRCWRFSENEVEILREIKLKKKRS